MAQTPNLALPLLEAGQAQKHVTVNEALSLMDAQVNIQVLSASLTAPPAEPAEGARYIAPAGAGAAWGGADGDLAAWINGGWQLFSPQIGWRVFDVSSFTTLLFDGARWLPGALSVSNAGAATLAETLVYDHQLTPGPHSQIAAAIPDRSVVLGVTARVTTALAGPASWRLGPPDADNRYGSGLGLNLNSYAHGVTGAPVGYFADTPLRLTAEGADFSAGAVRIAVHLLRLTPPSSI